MHTEHGRDLERETVIVRGRVQGVGYRFFAQRRAAELGLRGYVRNRPDGAVEVVAEGPRPALQELLRWLARGPSGARVEEIAAQSTAAEGTFTGFQIRV